jgi:ubiquinone/menaquinone biosynthesis C-methylase UbiE
VELDPPCLGKRFGGRTHPQFVKPDPNVIFEGSIPGNYDRYLGPAFFEPFAKDITARLSGERPAKVLEIACGTGILTRRLRDSLGSAVQLVATDLNPGMFAFAQRKFSANQNIKWQQADAVALPFPDGSFDALVCQFGLMFVPDKQTAMRECYRVLSPRGVFLFNVWDSIERNPIGRIAHETIASFFDRDPPNFYELPFGFYEADLIRGLLQRAGFKSIEVSLVTLPCRCSSAANLAIGLVRGNPVSTAIAERGVNVEDVVWAVSKEIAECYGAAPVESTMQAFVWRAVHE